MTQPPPVTDSSPPYPERSGPGTTQHPLGPWIYRVIPLQPVRARVYAAIALIGALAILTVAATVRPDRAGLGSHLQLGLPPCSLVVLTGFPCPTCGMTTAFAHTVRGHFLSAFQANPAGLCLAVLTVVVCAVSLSVLATGRVWTVNWYRLAPVKVTLAAVLLVLAGWAYKLAVGLASGTIPVAR